MPKEVFYIKGHENVLSEHRTTLEFTSEKELTKRGDCILGVSASRTMKDFSDEFKSVLRERGSTLKVKIIAGAVTDTVRAMGHPDLTFEDDEVMIIRKGSFVDERTLAVNSDKSAIDIDRRIVEALKAPATSVMVELTVRA